MQFWFSIPSKSSKSDQCDRRERTHHRRDLICHTPMDASRIQLLLAFPILQSLLLAATRGDGCQCGKQPACYLQWVRSQLHRQASRIRACASMKPAIEPRPNVPWAVSRGPSASRRSRKSFLYASRCSGAMHPAARSHLHLFQWAHYGNNAPKFQITAEQWSHKKTTPNMGRQGLSLKL